MGAFNNVPIRNDFQYKSSSQHGINHYMHQLRITMTNRSRCRPPPPPSIVSGTAHRCRTMPSSPTREKSIVHTPTSPSSTPIPIGSYTSPTRPAHLVVPFNKTPIPIPVIYICQYIQIYRQNVHRLRPITQYRLSKSVSFSHSNSISDDWLVGLASAQRRIDILLFYCYR